MITALNHIYEETKRGISLFCISVYDRKKHPSLMYNSTLYVIII